VANQVKLNRAGLRDLLRSPEVRRDLERRARQIATAAGPGFESDSEIGRNRARASVWTATLEAMVAEATDRALTRSIDAGRH
jgi:hypothetical protein